ncbi:MAG: hypothetical protein RRY95_05155 [Oscillospiraceae bacterium]
MKKLGFSKWLLLLETGIVLLTTWQGFALAREAVAAGYDGSLAWLAPMITSAWGAYGTSAAFYYNKAKAENTAGGIVYDAAFRQDCD